MALAMNSSARRAFESLTDEEKRQVLERTHGVRSKEEMRGLVNSLLGPEGLF